MGNNFFPVSIDLKNKNILVIGAGKIAFRKVQTLLEYECNVKVITKEVIEEKFYSLVEDKKIYLEENYIFSEKDLENIFLVIAATNDEDFNCFIANLCMKKNILVNNISSKEKMNLKFSSIYRTDEFQIAVSTYEGNPKKAVEIRDRIKKFFEKIRGGIL